MAEQIKNIITNKAFEILNSLLKDKKNIFIEESILGVKAALVASVNHLQQDIVIITNESVFSSWLTDLSLFSSKELTVFPCEDSLFEEGSDQSYEMSGIRSSALVKINRSKHNIIITTLTALSQSVPSQINLLNNNIIIKKGDSIDFNTLWEMLQEMGYIKSPLTEEAGEFSTRGSIIDIFPFSYKEPIRLEFIDNKIESLRIYNPLTQKSLQIIDQLEIFPKLNSKNITKACFFDWFKDNPPLIVLDNIENLEDSLLSSKQDFSTNRKDIDSKKLLEIIKKHQLMFVSESSPDKISDVKKLPCPKGQSVPFIGFEIFNSSFEAYLYPSSFISIQEAFKLQQYKINEKNSLNFITNAINEFNQDFELYVFFIYQNAKELENIKNSLKEDKNKNITITFVQGNLTSGFYIEHQNLCVISTVEFTHRFVKYSNKQRSFLHMPVDEIFRPSPGDIVVHMDNGIGKFIGTESRKHPLTGILTEFMNIEYAQGSLLSIPMEQANLISKYIGANAEKLPELHTLGTSKWKKQRDTALKAATGYAVDLIKLQAERACKPGFAFPKTGDLVHQFEDAFPYQETPDQLTAISKIFTDMESKRPMDRLVCGDAGYGKTEVAMRAAFKAVADGNKQVVVLVPTTVLASQHFETFSNRMRDFSISIKMVSRFQSKKELDQTILDIKEGTVDIIIATQRILKNSVEFHDLGLIIIDEEQRFGVRSKEHLKKFKLDVDCLSLSATPIPRSLYMSLIGARDFSVIATPPEDRLPISAKILSRSENIIRQALSIELERKGQAYFIHNRVETIFNEAKKLQEMFPNAKIGVAHGQMKSDDIEKVFYEFKEGLLDILVATSIVESGIDIQNANTILIDRADHFGVADLYQIRGRVGRWNKKAYCYFMVNNLGTINAITRKRLTVLVDTQNSSGMKIAMHDLELRGAGNIIGTEQSGHVSSIGFSLYCKLLKKAVSSIQNNETPTFSKEIQIELPFSGSIPEDYISVLSLRLEFYHKFGEATSWSEIDDYLKEMKDRFGTLPNDVEALALHAKMRIFATDNQFVTIKVSNSLIIAKQCHGSFKKEHKIPILSKGKNFFSQFDKNVIEMLKKYFPMKDLSY